MKKSKVHKSLTMFFIYYIFKKKISNIFEMNNFFFFLKKIFNTYSSINN